MQNKVTLGGIKPFKIKQATSFAPQKNSLSDLNDKSCPK